MYGYFIENPVVAVILMVLLTICALLLFVKAMQKIGLEKVRGIVYDGFVKAEHEFQHGENEQKFDYVVQLARSAIPNPFKVFVTESVLRKVVQLWFDLCKDLLDDGKLNGTSVK